MWKKLKHNISKADGRSLLLMKNVFASFFIKGWSILVGLMMVPLTLHCLGTYQNGVWLTISSLLLWIDQMDIGLGSGLRNSLATHIAHDNYVEARKVISSTFAMLFCIMLPVMVILLSLLYFCDIYAFLNVESSSIPDLHVALITAVTLVCITFVMKFINNVYLGMQMPAISNLIMVVGQTTALVGTWTLMSLQCATFYNVILMNTAAPLVVYIFMYPYTFRIKFPHLKPSWKDVDMHSALQLGNLSVKFFWLQIAGMIQFMTANILISKFFTPEMVTPYQITYRYMSLIMVIFTVVCAPFWNATTDAFERDDIDWIRKASHKMNLMLVGISFLLLFMVAVSPLVYSIWIGDRCDVPFGMTVMMAIYILCLVVSLRYSCFLNGIGALRLQNYMSVVALIFIPLAWFVCRETQDILWFMAVMCFCNLPGIIMNIIQFNKIINGTATGIWRR